MTDISKAPSHFKPGRTSKLNERHFVVHNYHDYALDGDDPAKAPIRRRKGGVTVPFPIRLHQILAQVDQDGLAHIFSWQPHGRCFLIHKPKEFIDLIMPKYVLCECNDGTLCNCVPCDDKFPMRLEKMYAPPCASHDVSLALYLFGCAVLTDTLTTQN
jgi:hypothetical protein